MSSLTEKLFEKLSSENKSVEINAELLSYFQEFSKLDEYQRLVNSVEDPVSRTENLKKLVFRLYDEKRLKDLNFFKYLVWSNQADLCKLIGYGDKQIEKLKKDRPPQGNQKSACGHDKNNGMDSVVPDGGNVTQSMMHNQKLHLFTRGNDKMDLVPNTDHAMETDRPNTDDAMETDRPILSNVDAARMITTTEDDQMFKDRPIRQNEGPVTTTHEITPTNIPKPTVGPTYIIYSKEHSDHVFELSDFLRKRCGISCDIDQYHMQENIPQWEVWKENKIKELAKQNGFVLLICSPEMHQQLSEPGCSRIQMKVGHIDTPTLNNLIRDSDTTHCIIPVCLEELNKEIVPSSLRGRTIYFLSFSKLMKVDPNADLNSILDIPEFESLRSLVYILRGEEEINRPPLGGLKH